MFSVSHSVHGGSHVTITHDALDLTIEGLPLVPNALYMRPYRTSTHIATVPPPASDIWWWRLETYSIKFVHPCTLPQHVLTPGGGYWSVYSQCNQAKYTPIGNIIITSFYR